MSQCNMCKYNHTISSSTDLELICRIFQFFPNAEHSRFWKNSQLQVQVYFKLNENNRMVTYKYYRPKKNSRGGNAEDLS